MDVNGLPAFHEWFFRELADLDISDREFARRVGVSSGTVTHWKSGRSIPLPPSCRRIAEFFGIDPLWVLALAGHVDPNDTEVQRMIAAREAKETFERATQANEEVRRTVYADRGLIWEVEAPSLESKPHIPPPTVTPSDYYRELWLRGRKDLSPERVAELEEEVAELLKEADQEDE